MYFVMTIIWFILFIYQIKNLKTVWIHCWYQIKISHTMSISKMLTDLCVIRQKGKLKNTFEILFTMLY